MFYKRNILTVKNLWSTENSLSKSSQLHVGILESIFHLVVQRLLFALEYYGGTAVQDPLWGSFHHQKVLGFSRSCVLVDGELLERRKP